MNWIQHIKAAALCSGFMPFCFIAKGQNLVPNGDFEYYTTCPILSVNGAPVEFAAPWTSLFGNAGYNNRCDTVDNSSSVPITNGALSYQEPHSGNGYASFVFKFGPDYRDYAEVKLTDTLKAGHCYFVSFYVSLQNFMKEGCNNITAHFSDTFMHSNSPTGAISATQDIVAFSNPVIMDTTGWFRVSGIYSAHGGEQYITIGNFMDDAHTDTLHFNNDVGNDYSTYYLDDVSTEEVTAQVPFADAGSDTAINQGDSLFIGTLINGLTTQWWDGNGNAIASNVPGLWVHPSQSTDYILQQTVCGITSIDTVHIDVWPLGIKQTGNSKSLALFPNPTTGIVNIFLPKEGDWNVLVTDVQGRLVPVEHVNTLPTLMTLRINAAAGIYMLRVANNATGELTVKKLTLQASRK